MGIVYVKDLYNEGDILNHKQILELYDTEIDVVSCNSLLHAIPRHWKQMLRDQHNLERQLKIEWVNYVNNLNGLLLSIIHSIKIAWY